MKKIPIPLNDLQLAQMAREDEEAEKALLRRLYPVMFKVAWSVAGRRDLADDIAQIAALEVLKSLNSFKGIGSLESWATRITYRVYVKLVKKEIRSKNILISLDMLGSTESEKFARDENVERSVSRQNLFEKLTGLLETIPQKRRVPLLLHLAHGYTVNEVAELTDVSPNTVKDRLRTAYQEFRIILENHQELRDAILEEIP